MRRKLENIVRYLRGATAPEAGDGTSDQDLLQRYVREQDESAFATLMHRHGPLVWSVCRRILPESTEAEDAFQATFLVLARRASLLQIQCISAWLYGVATRVALRARSAAARRRFLEREAMIHTETAANQDEAMCQNDLRSTLDEELVKLPRRHREALVLCYLKGRTQEEASAEMGKPRGSIARWLVEGREILRGRLERRGVALTAAGWTALAEQGQAAVPAQLADLACSAALCTARGTALTGIVSHQAVALAEGILRDMARVRLQWLLVGTVGCCLVLGYATIHLLAAHQPADEPISERSVPLPAPDDVAHIAFSSNGERIVVAGSEQVLVCDARDGKSLFRFDIPRVNVEEVQVCLSPKGDWLAALVRGKLVHLWKLEGSPEGRLIELEGDSSFLVFSPDGQTFATAARDPRQVTIWIVATGKKKGDLPVQEGHVRAVAFHPDGVLLISAGSTISLWETTIGKELGKCAMSEPIANFTCSPDGKHFAFLATPTKLVVYDLERKEICQSLYQESIVDFLFLEDGRLQIVQMDPQLRPRCWDLAVRTGERRERLRADDAAWLVRCSPRGDALAVINLDSTASVWRLK